MSVVGTWRTTAVHTSAVRITTASMQTSRGPRRRHRIWPTDALQKWPPAVSAQAFDLAYDQLHLVWTGGMDLISLHERYKNGAAPVEVALHVLSCCQRTPSVFISLVSEDDLKVFCADADAIAPSQRCAYGNNMTLREMTPQLGRNIMCKAASSSRRSSAVRAASAVCWACIVSGVPVRARTNCIYGRSPPATEAPSALYVQTAILFNASPQPSTRKFTFSYV